MWAIFFLVLFLPSIASAECGWILWEGFIKELAISKEEFHLKNGYESYQDCIAAAKDENKRAQESFGKLKWVEITPHEIGFGFCLIEKREDKALKISDWRYICLPGSFDPRK